MKRLVITAAGIAAGWVCMHNGGWCVRPENRYLPWGGYTPANQAELDAATERGEFGYESGNYVHVGGILYNWVPVVRQ